MFNKLVMVIICTLNLQLFINVYRVQSWELIPSTLERQTSLMFEQIEQFRFWNLFCAIKIASGFIITSIVNRSNIFKSKMLFLKLDAELLISKYILVKAHIKCLCSHSHIHYLFIWYHIHQLCHNSLLSLLPTHPTYHKLEIFYLIIVPGITNWSIYTI